MEEAKKVGRPKKKTGAYKSVNISLPLELYEQAQVASKANGKSLTEYIGYAIQQDLERNGAIYDQITRLQEQLT